MPIPTIYHNPNAVEMYVKAKAEDIKNPKNPLSQRDGPSLGLILFFVILIIGIYAYSSQITYTYTSIENAKMNTNFELVDVVESDRNTYRKVLIKQEGFDVTSEEFYLHCTSRKIKDLYYNVHAINGDQEVSIYHNYTNDTQTLQIKHHGLNYEDVYLNLTENDFLKSIFRTYTSSYIDYEVYDQLFNQFSSTYEFGALETLSKEYEVDENTIQRVSLGFVSYQNTVKLNITFEFIKK